MSAWVALGDPEPGYELLWYVAVVIAGAMTTVPVIVYLALKWLLDKF